jgi:hypothetical protein
MNTIKDGTLLVGLPHTTVPNRAQNFRMQGCSKHQIFICCELDRNAVVGAISESRTIMKEKSLETRVMRVQPLDAEAIPRRAAIFTREATESAFILCIT